MRTKILCKKKDNSNVLIPQKGEESEVTGKIKILNSITFVGFMKTYNKLQFIIKKITKEYPYKRLISFYLKRFRREETN